LQKLTLHITPDADVREAVVTLVGPENVESLVARDPTLEEAYLTLLK